MKSERVGAAVEDAGPTVTDRTSLACNVERIGLVCRTVRHWIMVRHIPARATAAVDRCA